MTRALSLRDNATAPAPAEAAPRSSFVPPLVAGLLVAGVLVYIQVADLDAIEARSLAFGELLVRLGEHVRLVIVSTLVVVALGVPLGILLSRPAAGPLQPPVLAVANAGQAIPSIGILVLLALLYDVGFAMAVISLVVYALLPVLRNTMVGLRHVDRSIIDAARGMGMGSRRILFTVELPLAVPVMLAGIRVALILNVGVATLATYTDAGGLGDLIERGIVFYRMPILLSGCLLTIALALLVDWLAGVAETRLRPRGL
ncbi:MAG: ABC transporter permease subunit [Actinophytocola sp.]|nr:ABC transporter permease subunit [Actinophytocola sp.]